MRVQNITPVHDHRKVSCNSLRRLACRLLVRRNIVVQLLRLRGEIRFEARGGLAGLLGLRNLHNKNASEQNVIQNEEDYTLMLITWTSPASLRTLFLILPT